MPFFFRRGLAFLLAVGITAVAGCNNQRDRSAAGRVIGIDDFGDTLRLTAPPQRIVSLTPASTELLFALGAGPKLVGRTHWDIWPDEARFVPDVGDGIRPNIEAVLATRPDLVLLYGSEENRGSARRIRQAGVQTLSLKVDLPEHFRRLTLILGRALDDSLRAHAVVASVDSALNAVRSATRNAPRTRVVWVADADPLILIGGGSFLTELIEIAGGENVFADIPGPSAPMSMESVVARNPDVVLASRTLLERIRSNPALAASVGTAWRRLVESDSYSMGRPSVRMGEAAHQLARIFHPELFR